VGTAVEYSKLALTVRFERGGRASMVGDIDKMSDDRQCRNMDTIRT